MGENIIQNKTPKVSVIIPIWNTEKYLETCLDSVVNQTLKDIEIICVNNGSTDSCPQIIEKYARNDDRIKVVNIEHGCLSGARNEGIKAATAPYITFVDSDDWISLDNYELAIKEFENNQDIDIVCWGANIINLDLEEDSSYVRRAKNYHKLKIFGKQELTDETVLNSTVCVWNKMFKSKIIKDNNVLFPIGVDLEDNSFFYTYVSNCKYAYYMDKYFYNYVQRKNSTLERLVHRNTDIIAPRLKNLCFMVEYYDNHNQLNQNKNIILTLLYYYFSADYNNAKDEYRNDVLSLAKNFAYICDKKGIRSNLIYNLKKEYFKDALSIANYKMKYSYSNNFVKLQKFNDYFLVKILGVKISAHYEDFAFIKKIFQLLIKMNSKT